MRHYTTTEWDTTPYYTKKLVNATEETAKKYMTVCLNNAKRTTKGRIVPKEGYWLVELYHKHYAEY